MIRKISKLIILSTSTLLLLYSSFVFAAGDVNAGKVKSSTCSFCHGPDGKGMGKNPAIAGLDKNLFTSHILDFKTGKRKNSMMENMAKKLSDQDVEDLAAFYSSL